MELMGLVALYTLVFALWCGPTVCAAIFARRRKAARGGYALAALGGSVPLVLLELFSSFHAVRTYDGRCHHAPDIVYSCSLLRAVVESMLPVPFALPVFLLLGLPAFAWGLLCFFAGRRRERRRMVPLAKA